MYDGERRAPGDESVLIVVSALEIMDLDGRRFVGFFRSGDQSLALLPGDHALVVRFHDVYTTEADTEEVVLSDFHALTLDLEAGRRYRLECDQPGDASTARRRVKDLELWLVDLASDTRRRLTSQSLGSSLAWAIETTRRRAENNQSPTSGSEPEPEAREPGDTESDATTELEKWWQRATPEERARFLERHGEAP